MRHFPVPEAWLISLAVASPLTSCREATEVTVEITTDINCADRPKTGVSLGPPSQIESRPLATATEQCDASTGRIGSIVLIPDKDKGEEFGLRVVAGMTMSAEECIQRGYVGGCVVSRRVLSFVPHDHLRLPIRLEASCIDVPCNATQTCRGGSCVSAVIADPSACTSGSGCDVIPNFSGGGAAGATTAKATTSSVGGAPLAGGATNYLAGGAPTQTHVTTGGTLATDGTLATGGASGANGLGGAEGTGASAGAFGAGGASSFGGASASGGVPGVGGAPSSGGVPIFAGASSRGGTSAGAGAPAAGGSSSGSGGSTAVSPLCSMTAGGSPTIKGGTCTPNDTQLCYWTCGPIETGSKTETCTAGIYVEGDCMFPADVDYSCFRVPASDSAGCPTSEPQSGQPCSVSTCSLPCSGTACAICGVATGYRDSIGMHKDGYCVCLAGSTGNRWSCASKTAWPCPSGQGC
ncbi:MAG TPA: hypothetical protein VKP30_17250 [Polyangiaceae bacterium]|nr:hypothetical protein [Polyangiaceae bacterium]